jgi:hypothetical protein
MKSKQLNYTWIFPALLLAGIIIWGWNNIWRSPRYFPQSVSNLVLSAHIMTMDEYNQVVDTHARPYIVQIEENPGAVLLYGSEHTRDPNDPQITDIQIKWEAFKPTIALVEGRLGFLAEGFMNPITEFGEGGLVYKLARDDGLPAYTWELQRENEVALMLAKYPKEQVALFYILRPYAGNLRYGKPEDQNAVLKQYIKERTQIPGLEDTFKNVEDIDRIWNRDFKDYPDWRDTSDEYGWPGYLDEIADAANTIRNEHLAQLIVYFVREGERVFVVAGSSHAVSLDAALHIELEQSPK